MEYGIAGPYSLRLGVKFETILHESAARVEYGFKFHNPHLQVGVFCKHPKVLNMQNFRSSDDE